MIHTVWANNDSVYFLANQDGRWGLYFQHLGEPARLVASLADGVSSALAVRR